MTRLLAEAEAQEPRAAQDSTQQAYRQSSADEIIVNKYRRHDFNL